MPSIGNGSSVGGTVYSIKYNASNDIIINGGSFSSAYEAKSTILTNSVAYYNVANYTWNPLQQIVVPYGIKNVSSPSGRVYAILYDSGTKIYVGGDFINAGGISANNIAVFDTSTNIWYGLVDSTTKVNGVNGIVRCLCFYSGLLYVGGDFTTAGGTTVNYISSWNSNTNIWSSLLGGTSGTVYSLATNNSDLFVGGNFTDAGGGSYPGVNYIATWNGGTWGYLTDSTYSSSGTNGPVYAITYGGSLTYSIIIGGSFSSVAGGAITANNIVAWNNTNFAPLSNFSGEGTNLTVYALAIGGWGISPTTNTVVYVGGSFTSVGGGTVGAQYLAAFDYSNNSWNIVGNNSQNTLNGTVRTLNYPSQNGSIPFDSRLFIGGDFSSAGILDYYTTYSISSPVNGILLLQETGSISTSQFNTLPNLSSTGGTLYSTGTNGVAIDATDGVYSIYCLGNGSNQVIVGGYFSGCYINGTSKVLSHNVAILTIDSSWSAMSSSQIPALDSGEVNAIVRVGSKIYVGGQFNGLISGNQTLNNFAYWDTATYLWYSIISDSRIGVNGTIYSIEPYTANSIFLGGSFTGNGANTVNRIGIFNTATNTWLIPGTGVNNIVRDIYYSSGTTAYICGDFTTTGNGATPIYSVAKINLSLNDIDQITNNSGSNIGMNGTVYSNIFLTPNIYFGGIFTNTLPTSNLPMTNLSYFLTNTQIIPLSVTTSAIGFLNTENGTTYTTITIPTRYKLITIIYNSSLNKWLVTYRSPGLTFS